ncbi:MAG: acyltransferase [Alphaproteobacteria bacterium]|nr:acyltransferase [Alphaproteobacteria bacterium]
MTEKIHQVMPSPERFHALDSFRGLCALLVAMAHFNAYSIFHHSPIFDRGGIYVDFFFVLSGFVIFANYGEKLRNGFGMGKFIWLRFWRLYPLHIFVFLAFVGSDLAQMIFHVEGAALYKPFSAPGEGWDAILSNVFLLHSMGVLDVLSFNGPSWSISVEFYTYILFALVLVVAPRHYRMVLAFLAIVSAWIVYINHYTLFAKLDFGYFRCIYGFICGVFAFEIYSRVKNLKERFSIKMFTLVESVLLVLVISYIGFGARGLDSFAAPIVFLVTVVLFSFEGGMVSKLLKMKFFLLLGALSYSIYMTHIFISGKLFSLPVRLLENFYGLSLSTDINGTPFFGTNLIMGTGIELFYLCVVVACSYVSYRLIEEPCRKWSKRRLASLEAKKECKVTQEISASV